MSINGSQPESTFELIKNHLLSTGTIQPEENK